MIKQIIILAGLVFLFCTSYSQGKPRNEVGLSISWQNFQFLDKHSSPLKYGTNSLFPKVGLYYHKETSRSVFNVHVRGSLGNIYPTRFGARTYQSKLNNTDSFQYQVSSQLIHADIEASYFKKINPLSNDKLTYLVGGTINETAYYADKVANTPWLLNVVDIAPSFQLNYLPQIKHSLSMKLDLFVLGVITRPIYALFPKSSKDKNVPAYFKQGTSLASLNRFQKVAFQFGYQYQLTNKFAVGVEYRLKWMHYSLPKSIRTIDKSFEVKLAYTY
jgi:hypothetical protein